MSLRKGEGGMNPSEYFRYLIQINKEYFTREGFQKHFLYLPRSKTIKEGSLKFRLTGKHRRYSFLEIESFRSTKFDLKILCNFSFKEAYRCSSVGRVIQERVIRIPKIRIILSKYANLVSQNETRTKILAEKCIQNQSFYQFYILFWIWTCEIPSFKNFLVIWWRPCGQ